MTDISALRAAARRAAIRHTLYAVWPRPLGPGLIAESLSADVAANPDELNRALAYLVDRGHLVTGGQTSGAAPVALFRLTPDGVDKVEADPARDPNSVRTVRMLRLRVLQSLSWGGPAPMGVGLIAVSLTEDTDLDLSEPSIRRALAYLTDPTRHLAAEPQAGLYRITADGTDYLSGEGDGIEGVARPQVW